MSNSVTDKWNAIYSKNDFGFFPPSQVLHQNQHLLPKSGRALDLACGHGRNAVHLSRLGFETYAYDISDVALNKLKQYAETEGLNIKTKVCDLTQEKFDTAFFDVIVISHFLDRNMIPDIKNALTKQGLIFYQTFTKIKVEDVGPSNSDYLLDRNELLDIFQDFHVLAYKDETDVGNVKEGLRNEALIVAQKN